MHNFLTNSHSRFEFICFLQILSRKGFPVRSSSIQKIKEAEFLLELTKSLREYLLFFANNYREVDFNAFSIFFSSCSRYKKFKEAEFFYSNRPEF